jgi:hypothetical protein
MLIAAFAPGYMLQNPSPTLAEIQERLMGDLFRYEPPPGGTVAYIKGIGPPDLVKAALLNILEESYPLVPGKRMPLTRVIEVVAMFGYKEAIPKIRLVLADGSLDQTTRMVSARALGRLDAEGNKQVLLTAFDQCTKLESTVRVAIAEALAQTRDRSVLAKLETWARGEAPGTFERKHFDRIVSEMRTRLQQVQ